MGTVRALTTRQGFSGGCLQAVIAVSTVLFWTARTLAADLAENTFTQVINDVSVVSPATKDSRKAAVNDVVKSPDLIRTGPNSRAELRAPDATLTRIGANTIFAFDPKGRSLDLQKGSVLFHSPKGRGGGTIKTGGASAAVLGTTLVIVATPDGGFKGIVLEGRGKFTLPDGTSRNLDAGQLLFVQPGQRGFSPILDINLSKLVTASSLVQGYANELPSISKVNTAIQQQDTALRKGRMKDTGLLVGNKATKEGVTVIDTATFEAALKSGKSVVDLAWNRDADLLDYLLPAGQLFRRDQARYPKASQWESSVAYALLGDSIEIRTPDLVLPSPTLFGLPAGVRQGFGIIAKDRLRFTGSIDFSPPLPGPGPGPFLDPALYLGAARLEVSDYSQIRYLGDANFSVASLGTMRLDGVEWTAQGGDMKLWSREGSVKLNGGRVTAGPASTAELVSDRGNVELAGTSVTGKNISIRAGDLLLVQNSNFQMNTGFGGGTVGSLRMEATTLVLQNVDLPANRPVHLVSRDGVLAPNPNTRAARVNGAVNFYEGVTSGGQAAQFSVRTPQNPAGHVVISAQAPTPN